MIAFSKNRIGNAIALLQDRRSHYGFILEMTKRDKLWQKAKESPQNLSFDEFETLLRQSNWTLERQEGSHRLWISPKGQTLPIQPRKDGKAKSYQIQQFFLMGRQERVKSLRGKD